ncbi:unnamed protein product [Eruca vesicaria subsp. sativa]|uniref:Avr9/Cf-9 rapidly elicited protein n=1 Tax=Eruca vesicaria subsp. sativa TaxID=29727 RepID=A0ABC8JSM7_ERUVS|nr:unnamed protein product [Eruca vesicaria subsp. sativa]
MNSMFSAFDAMCAEMMGKKVTAASYICNPSERNGASSGVGGGQTASSLKKDEKATNFAAKQPRCALELDGLNFFETIVRS